MGKSINENLILKLVILLSLLALHTANSYADTLEVGSEKKYSSIQAAINASNCGDTIEIYTGTYNENVLINNTNPGSCSSSSPLTIRSAEAGVIIDGGANGNCIEFDHTKYIEWDNTANGRIQLQNCGTAYDDPNHTQYTGHGILAWNTTDFIIKGFNIVSSGTSPSKFPHTGGDDSSHPDFYANSRGVYIRQNRNATTRTDWSELAEIDIDCDNSFSDSLFVLLSNKIKINHIKAVRAGSKYACFIKGSEDIIFEKNYCWYSNDVKTYNEGVSGLARVRGMSLRVRDAKRNIVRYNVFDSTGSAGQMMDVLFDDQDSGGFDGEPDSDEQGEYYNNTQICDMSPQSDVTRGCFSITNQITGMTFANNLIYITNNETAVHKGYCGGVPDYVLQNFSFNKTPTETSHQCDTTDFVWKDRFIGNPYFAKSGDKPNPYYRIAEWSDSIVDVGSNGLNYNGTDYASISQKNGIWDIGAFEYTTSGNITDNVPPEPPTLISID